MSFIKKFSSHSLLKKAVILSVPFCLVLFLATSCSHYKLGAAADLPFCSLYVAPAKNRSLAPQTQALITQQVIEAFNRDGQVKIVSCEEQADASLHITLTDLQRHGAAYSRTDTGLATAFDMTLSATISLYDNCESRAYFCNKCVNATVETYVDDSLQQAEYQIMPELTRKLAQNIRDKVLSIW